jgi:dihydroorotate dehydrogenase (NAD+) catalytic subunit
VKIPVIGIGGITDGTDAIEFLLAGAVAVQVGTANFLDPAVGITIAGEMKEYCVQQGVADMGSLVGALEAKTGVSVLDSWL